MNKFHAKTVVVDGIRFHSQDEANRWAELKLYERAGIIHNLDRQVPFNIVPECKNLNGKIEKPRKYIADFVYWKGPLRVVEDVKGCRKGMAYQMFKLKKDLMRYWYGIEVREVKSGDSV